ncbi:prenyltransferase [Chlorobaculum sp. 24CR]|uniref:UbiA family prenyltransferase n=1 Tax=Chlorobaculum sp. 24CR TaxID=2508878 RepID=UPI00100AA56A|nr:UbiA family prenyltransferase [Chlorobaculum sp. 24CR]RXK84893.1 prenyltransferase [Chlorobaculum sp. 24CR]
MNKSRVQGLFRLLRFELSFAAGACVVLAEVLALGGWPTLRLGIFGFLSVFSIAASVLILNDVFDIETDRINAPSRPLPAGVVTKREALGLSVAAALAGCALALMIGFSAFVAICAMLLLGVLYDWKLKRYGLFGNLVVGFSVGMSFIFGGIAAGNPFEPVVLFLAVMTMLVDLGEEIAADALDVEGDRQSGSRSLAIVLGSDKAMRIATAVFALVIAASAAPFAAGWFGWPYLPPIIAFDAILVWSVWRLLDPRTPRKLRYIRRIYLAGTAMLLALIAIRLAAG